MAPGAGREQGFSLAGVQVSAVPDVTIIQTETERQVGAVKLHFSTMNRLNEDALRYAATMLFAYVEETNGRPLSGLCEAVDVFAAAHEAAPRATRRRLHQIEAACTEIAERWPTLLRQVLKQQAERAERQAR